MWTRPAAHDKISKYHTARQTGGGRMAEAGMDRVLLEEKINRLTAEDGRILARRESAVKWLRARLSAALRDGAGALPGLSGELWGQFRRGESPGFDEVAERLLARLELSQERARQYAACSRRAAARRPPGSGTSCWSASSGSSRPGPAYPRPPGGASAGPGSIPPGPWRRSWPAPWASLPPRRTSCAASSCAASLTTPAPSSPPYSGA